MIYTYLNTLHYTYINMLNLKNTNDASTPFANKNHNYACTDKQKYFF